VEPPTRRNRVWQFDFSAFETAAEGTWQLGGTVDYWAKVALGCRIAATKTSSDMIAGLEAAMATAEELIAGPLADDCVDPDTGELTPLIVVTASALLPVLVAEREPMLRLFLEGHRGLASLDVHKSSHYSQTSDILGAVCDCSHGRSRKESMKRYEVFGGIQAFHVVATALYREARWSKHERIASNRQHTS